MTVKRIGKQTPSELWQAIALQETHEKDDNGQTISSTSQSPNREELNNALLEDINQNGGLFEVYEVGDLRATVEYVSVKEGEFPGRKEGDVLAVIVVDWIECKEKIAFFRKDMQDWLKENFSITMEEASALSDKDYMEFVTKLLFKESDYVVNSNDNDMADFVASIIDNIDIVHANKHCYIIRNVSTSKIHRSILGRVMTTYLGNAGRNAAEPLREKFDADLERMFECYELCKNKHTLNNVLEIILDKLLENKNKEIVALAWHDEIPKNIAPGDPMPEEHFIEVERDGKKYFAMYSSKDAYDKYSSGVVNLSHGLLDFLTEVAKEDSLAGIVINLGSDVDMILSQENICQLLRLYEDIKQNGLKNPYKPVDKRHEKIGRNEITLQEAVVIAQNKAVELGAKLNPTMTICADGWACYFHNENGRIIVDEYQHFITLTGKYMEVKKDDNHSIMGVFADIKQYIKDIKAGKDIVGKKENYRWDKWNQEMGYRKSHEINLRRAVEIAIEWAGSVYFVGRKMRVAPRCVKVPDGWYFSIVAQDENNAEACGCFVARHGLRLIPKNLSDIPYSETERKELDIHEYVELLQERYDADKKRQDEETEKFMDLMKLCHSENADEKEIFKKYFDLRYSTLRPGIDKITQEMRDWLMERHNVTFEEMLQMDDAEYSKILQSAVDETFEKEGTAQGKLMYDIVTVLDELDKFI